MVATDDTKERAHVNPLALPPIGRAARRLVAPALAALLVAAAPPAGRAQTAGQVFAGAETVSVAFVPVTEDTETCGISNERLRPVVAGALAETGLDLGSDGDVVLEVVSVSSYIESLRTCSTYLSLRVTAPIEASLPYNEAKRLVSPILWYRSNMIFGGTVEQHGNAVAHDVEAWTGEFVSDWQADQQAGEAEE